MRTFIGLPLSAEIKQALKDIQNSLKACHTDVRWIPAQNMHITLKFLGDPNETLIHEKIIPIVKKASEAFFPLTVNLIGFGFFPSQWNPRVFFISTDHEGVLLNMADYLENELQKIGIKKENRFASHITIARLNSAKNIDCIERKMDIYPPHGNFPVEEIILFKSTLTPKGALYEPLFKTNFKT